MTAYENLYSDHRDRSDVLDILVSASITVSSDYGNVLKNTRPYRADRRRQRGTDTHENERMSSVATVRWRIRCLGVKWWTATRTSFNSQGDARQLASQPRPARRGVHLLQSALADDSEKRICTDVAFTTITVLPATTRRSPPYATACCPVQRPTQDEDIDVAAVHKGKREAGRRQHTRAEALRPCAGGDPKNGDIALSQGNVHASEVDARRFRG